MLPVASVRIGDWEVIKEPSSRVMDQLKLASSRSRNGGTGFDLGSI